MMAAAGEYDVRVEWFKKTPGGVDSFGARLDAVVESQGYLWGAIDDRAVARVTEKESNRQLFTATIRLRNYPEVGPGDTLREAGTGIEWTVLTAQELDDEVACEAEHR